MKPFTKRLALVMGLLFTAMLCLGIVYIDTVQNYWRVGGTGNGFVELIVSNKIVMSISTNTGRIGINATNANTFSVVINGQQPVTNAVGNGTSAGTVGGVIITGGTGGGTFAPTTATGGAGAVAQLIGGEGGFAPLATTNATGGNGGAASLLGGLGGMNNFAGAATNAITGGNGGGVTVAGGSGGTPFTASTNAVGGTGGATALTGGDGGSPSAGWARKGGNGGANTIRGGNGGTGVRTNGGNGGNLLLTGGNGGAVTASGGDAGAPGLFSITGGAGAVATGGGTNSDGGPVFIAGGAPGAGAVPGNVVLARTSAGTSTGAGVQIGPLITGGSATITNALAATLALDFPSTAAGTFSDLPVPITGVTSNNFATSLSVPWESAQLGGAFVCYNSNATVYVRFINNLVTAIDPTPGDFTVVGFRIR